MSKIKIGAQVTAKVRHTNVTVSGTFQGYELEDQEDPTSGCGKVLYVKDGMMHLDRVYIDSIKVCENNNDTMRKRIINILTNNTDAHEEGAALYAEEIAWLKNYWKPSKEQIQALTVAIDEAARCEDPWWRDSLHDVLLSLHTDLQKL